MKLLSRFTWFVFACAFSFLAASLVLIYQYKLGVPYPFATNVGLAFLGGVVVPFVAVIAYSTFAPAPKTVHRFTVYCLTAFVISLGLGLAYL